MKNNLKSKESLKNKKRILLVDDEPSVTNVVRLMLERTNSYVVQTENTSEHLLSTAKNFNPDLIVMDVMMPGCDGGTMAGRLKENPSLSGVPIVFLTGSVTRKEVNDGGGYIGGLRFLAKPVGVTELMDCVSNHLC